MKRELKKYENIVSRLDIPLSAGEHYYLQLVTGGYRHYVADDRGYPIEVKGIGSGIGTETDPTVASFIKAITQNDINNWNNNSGGNYGNIDGGSANSVYLIGQVLDGGNA